MHNSGCYFVPYSAEIICSRFASFSAAAEALAGMTGLCFSNPNELRLRVEDRIAAFDPAVWTKRGYKSRGDLAYAVTDAVQWLDGFTWNKDMSVVFDSVFSQNGTNDVTCLLDEERRAVPTSVDALFSLDRDRLAALVDEQYRKDFRGARADVQDDEAMRIRMTI